MRQWTHAEYTDAAGREIERMADVVAKQDMSVPVPTCPGWDVGALVAHTGGVHRWAAAMVRDLAERRYDREAMDLGVPEDRAGYAAWLREGGPILVEALRAQDPAAPVWVWGGDRHVRWWSRRQLHETAVHRVDAEIALGMAPEIGEHEGADGVEEFLDNLPYARWRPRIRELTGEGETISLQSDSGAGWVITLNPDGFSYERSQQPGTVTVRAASSGDLMLLAWNRRRSGDYSVEGDASLLTWWLERACV
ncbi:uncharacterized protein (TIGR03083 family) [Thermocatellispora tengchongensis]|uniref:Uncharacterized protein (TIGR03083 family) n=1 Tax=Thermocatellispora tengchongensis TaxID=1073253 RepID=A0A840PF51_9ACTN|nr:maleylpyruvate isomerase family mycothiol-dependent enzyme [Thermocatellispora tengchongensis]MBB5140054.1 uncharacterized protein (TIGR03083 family) [Thermocatellispora tengchongensis]